MYRFSVRANDELKHNFAVMFPDSKIAILFSMTRTNTICVINPVSLFQNFAVSLKRSDINLYSFDESLNEFLQIYEMVLYICYWDVIGNQVKVRYLGSTFLFHRSHQDILNNFIDIMKDLNYGHFG